LEQAGGEASGYSSAVAGVHHPTATPKGTPGSRSRTRRSRFFREANMYRRVVIVSTAPVLGDIGFDIDLNAGQAAGVAQKEIVKFRGAPQGFGGVL